MIRFALRSLPVALLAFLSTLPACLLAQRGEAIQFDQVSKVFRIDAGGVTYAFGVNDADELQPLYWGRELAATDKLAAAHTLPEAAAFDGPETVTQGEYKGWGGQLYLEPSLKVSFADGNRDLVLHYVSHSIEGDTLTVLTKDIQRDLFVELRYAIEPATGLLGRSAVIRNGTKEPVLIEQAAAATWNLPRGTDYTLRYLTGRWAGEWNLQEEAIRPGQRVLESRRGSTGHQNNPWFAIERGAGTDEDSGDVWFGALAWSGSWRITVEQDQLQQVRVTGGFNPFDFGYKLMPGKTLETPVFYGGYSHEGIGGASRLMHRFELDEHSAAGTAPQAAARALQLVGGNRIQRDRGGAGGARGEGCVHWRGAVRDGRWLVWAAQERSRGTGRLVCEPAEVSAWPEAADRQGAFAGDGLWACGLSRRW